MLLPFGPKLSQQTIEWNVFIEINQNVCLRKATQNVEFMFYEKKSILSHLNGHNILLINNLELFL